MKSSFDIIRTIIQTEKSTNLEKNRQYCFLVATSSNKIEIKRAVEEIYKVKVQAVRTFILPGKLKKVRYQYGYTPDQKKAVVTLKEGSKIDVL